MRKHSAVRTAYNSHYKRFYVKMKILTYIACFRYDRAYQLLPNNR